MTAGALAGFVCAVYPFHLTITAAVELRNGEMYRGRLVEAEDNMSCQLSGIVLTGKDGKVTSLEQVCVSPAPVACLSYLSLPLAVHVLHSMLNPLCRSYLRGSHVRFMILPDMLKHAPMFNRIDPKQGSLALLCISLQKSLLVSALSFLVLFVCIICSHYLCMLLKRAFVFCSCIFFLACADCVAPGVLRGKGVGVDRGRGGRGRGGMRGR